MCASAGSSGEQTGAVQLCCPSTPPRRRSSPGVILLITERALVFTCLALFWGFSALEALLVSNLMPSVSGEAQRGVLWHGNLGVQAHLSATYHRAQGLHTPQDVPGHASTPQAASSSIGIPSLQTQG